MKTMQPILINDKHSSIADTPSGLTSRIDSYRWNPLDRLLRKDEIIENFKRLKIDILNSQKDNHRPISILFTSATPKEGTSTIVFNYAIAMAAGGAKVVLVDGNLNHPCVHSAFNLEKKNGLMEMAHQLISLPETVKKTTVKNLFVITSGMYLPNPYIEFKPDILQSITNKLKKSVDIILFDSPALNSNSYISSTMANVVESIVLVIQAEKTRWQVIQNAKTTIEPFRDKIVGAVLNRRKVYIPQWLYERL